MLMSLRLKFADRPSAFCAAHGRWLLVLGLLTGIFAENFAVFLKAYIPEMAMALLFLAAFRVGPKAAIGAALDFRKAIAFCIDLSDRCACLSLFRFCTCWLDGILACGNCPVECGRLGFSVTASVGDDGQFSGTGAAVAGAWNSVAAADHHSHLVAVAAIW